MCLTKQEYCKKCDAIVEKREVTNSRSKGVYYICIACKRAYAKAYAKAYRAKMSTEEKKEKYLACKKKLHESRRVKPNTKKEKVFDNQGNQRCNKCMVFKPVDNFQIINKKTNNRNTTCYSCMHITWKLNSPDKYKAKIERQRQQVAVKRKTEDGLSRMRAANLKYKQGEYFKLKQQSKLEKRLLQNLYNIAQWHKCPRCLKLKLYRNKYIDTTLCPRCCTIGYKIKPYKVVCKKCGVEHIAANGRALCYKCLMQSHKEHKSAKLAKRNAQIKKTAIIEKVNPYAVFNRDKWRCNMCKCKVQKIDITAMNAAELDHIMPLSKGGVHTYSNVQTLCRKCNHDKRDNLIGQLVMFI